MPKISKNKEITRVMQSMAVLQFMTRGLNKESACAEVGISTWVFDDWVAKDHEAIEQLQMDIVEAERIRLAQLANTQAILLTRLIQNVTTEGYADHDMQLKVLKYVDSLRRELETKHGVQSRTDEASEYLMQGPNTRVEDSKMHVHHEQSRSVVNIKTKPDGSVDLTIPHESTIVDMFPALASGDDKKLPSAGELES